MADDNATNTAAVHQNQSLPSSSSSGDDDPPAPATGAAVNNQDPPPDPDADADLVSRDSKRRKMCPKALEKIEDFVPPTRTFSFTFDTKSGAGGPDVTPKFGSFHLLEESMPPLTAEDPICQIPARKDGDDGEVETAEEVLGVFEVVEVEEGVELNDRQFPTQIGEKLEL